MGRWTEHETELGSPKLVDLGLIEPSCQLRRVVHVDEHGTRRFGLLKSWSDFWLHVQFEGSQAIEHVKPYRTEWAD